MPPLSMGAPVAGSGSRGDLYVTIKVVLPTGLDEAGRALFQQLREVLPDSTQKAGPRDTKGKEVNPC